MKFNLYICILFILLFRVSYSNSTEWCEEQLDAVIFNKNLKGIESKIEEWKKYECFCSENGFYQKNLIDFYITNNEFEKAETYIKNELKIAQYDTREIEFFLAKRAVNHRH